MTVQRALGMIPIRRHVSKAQPHVVGNAHLWRAAKILLANPRTALTSPKTSPASATKNARTTGTVARMSLFAKQMVKEFKKFHFLLEILLTLHKCSH